MHLKWMTNNLRKEIKKNDRIVALKDMDALFEVKDNNDFSVMLFEILLDKWQNNLDDLSDTEKTLFLCMQLENYSQADDILSYLQGDFSEYKYETVHALQEINAIRSAKIVEQAVMLLPKSNEWFLKVADPNEKATMSKLSAEFSNYPDGYMCDLIREYADAHKEELIKLKQ